MNDVAFTKKQFSYPGLSLRLFAVCIDVWILGIAFWPFLYLFQKFLLPVLIQKYPLSKIQEQSNLDYLDQLDFSFISNENIDYSALYIYCSIILTINLLMTSSFWLTFWIYKQTSLGKMLFKIKVLNTEDLSIPTKKQYVIRMVSMICMPFGIITIPFNKKRQALHDMIAGTVVVQI
ncbi:RDD family protein [Rickettsiales endosymbiont of Paramecium tredecaurelia]|uniref:RDD family protein n=1 Tax=Candidatus Sarmatiella mevalonica TaxID=2770581 RepID=UPI001923D498|nr:RDD family protein [Candidatus Sarmatiella mevalonica]MBL3284228.1 RDD family protein [Candidatus Sarmatiella mevalonica]